MCGIVFCHTNTYDNELTGAFTRCNCLFHAMGYPFIRILKLSVLSYSLLICIEISCLNGDAGRGLKLLYRTNVNQAMRFG